MEINDDMFSQIKDHFGFNDDEAREFLENSRNKDVLSKSLELLNKTIVVEITESHGCNSQHKIGDRFYFDGAGNLLTKLNPKKVCIYALSELDKLIYAANELLYAGIDPNNMRFKRAGCGDVGLKNCGWGRVIMELQVVDREKFKVE
ncbi:MAG: hypothetical protein ACFFD4_00530 [Candidatus Odinarchaeota archaeon]